MEGCLMRLVFTRTWYQPISTSTLSKRRAGAYQQPRPSLCESNLGYSQPSGAYLNWPGGQGVPHSVSVGCDELKVSHGE
jgi:hypothetical protein